MIESVEETIAHHRWAAENCDGKPRDEHLQMVAWLEELVELRAWNSEFGCSMHDYNRGALKEPCLRLDYGWGEQWASVELGDGTGYVRLSDYEKLKAENTNLREFIRILHTAYVGATNECEELDKSSIWEFSSNIKNDLAKSKAKYEADRHRFDVAMRELGIEVE